MADRVLRLLLAERRAQIWRNRPVVSLTFSGDLDEDDPTQGLQVGKVYRITLVELDSMDE